MKIYIDRRLVSVAIKIDFGDKKLQFLVFWEISIMTNSGNQILEMA